MFCAFTIKAQQNLILNGSFELNNSTDDLTEFYNINQYDNTVHYSIEYGDNNTLSLIKNSVLTCLPSTYWGGRGK